MKQKKLKAYHEHKETHDLIKRKGSFDKESLVALSAKLLTRLK